MTIATLQHSETKQIVEGVDREEFLREIVDPSFWIEVTSQEAIETAVEPEPVIDAAGAEAPADSVEVMPGIVDVYFAESPDTAAPEEQH